MQALGPELYPGLIGLHYSGQKAVSLKRNGRKKVGVCVLSAVMHITVLPSLTFLQCT